MSEGKTEKSQSSVKFGLGFDARQRIGQEIKQALDGGLPNSSGQHYLDSLDRLDSNFNSLKNTTLEAEKARQEAETRAKQAEENFFIDPLTGCYGRGGWEDFQKHFDVGRGDKTTVILIDLNGFKTINDTQGHGVGDEYLKNVVSYFKEVFSRKGDRVFRIGGDEFAITCNFIEPEKREEFNSFVNSNFNHQIIDSKNIDFSYGIAFSAPEDSSVKDTIKRADGTMYQNKKEWKEKHPERYPKR